MIRWTYNDDFGLTTIYSPIELSPEERNNLFREEEDMSFQADILPCSHPGNDLPAAFEQKLDRPLTAGERRSLRFAEKRRTALSNAKLAKKDEWAEKEEIIQAHFERLKKKNDPN